MTSLDEFTDAVRRVHERGTVLDPLVVQGLLAARPDPLAALTPRERDVLELMAEGRSNASIAERLFIGVGAVEKNVSAIFAKLGLEESGDRASTRARRARLPAARLTRHARSPRSGDRGLRAIVRATPRGARRGTSGPCRATRGCRCATSWLGEVDLVESVDRRLDVDENGIHVGDHAADHVLPLREAGGDLRVGGLRGDRRQAGVDGQAEGDDALRGEVGTVLRVVDDRVEELVDRDEVRAADVPVRLLAVDGEGLQPERRPG